MRVRLFLLAEQRVKVKVLCFQTELYYKERKTVVSAIKTCLTKGIS